MSILAVQNGSKQGFQNWDFTSGRKVITK